MLTEIINLALKEYEINKGIYRKLFNFLGFGHAPAIRALRKLNLDKASEFQILECFIKNMPKKSKKTIKIYNAILSYLDIKEVNDVNMLTFSLKLLYQSKLLTEKNFNTVKNHRPFTDLTRALMKLKEAKILTQDYFDFVECHFPSKFAELLINLKAINCLTPEHFNAIKQHNDPSNLTSALIAFNSVQLLTAENFERLFQPQNNILLTLRIGKYIIWDRLPPHLLTQPVFEELIRRALLANPEDEISQYINSLLDDNEVTINKKQSIHTASIHRSISESAIKLWNRYGAELSESNIEESIASIKKYIANLPDSFINKAAKRCIERITRVNYIFTDPVSKVTLRQLLALSYLARHDKDKRQGSIEDANQQFIQGLYEIQRGYNLSAKNVDDRQADRPICTAGTFNKLMEKLSGIHPNVELIFMTNETAALKFQILVREEVKNYLQKLSKPETKEGFHSFINLLKQLSEEGIEIIWNRIKPQVSDRLFAEFKTIYEDNKKHSDFLALVDSGQYIEIKSNFSAYQQQMVSSTGYRKSCSQILQSYKFFPLKESDYLSEHRHDNPESQRRYDQKFALVPKNENNGTGISYCSKINR